jgi:hypothetical protein
MAIILRSVNIIKRLKCFIAFLVVFNILSLDSIEAQNKFEVGPILGPGISLVYDKGPDDYKSHLEIGIIGSYDINYDFALNAKIIVSTKGFGSIFYTEEKVNLTYMDAIFSTKYFFSDIPFIGLGTQVGYLAKASYSYEIDQYHEIHKSVGINNITNDFDFGLYGCMGFQFKSGIGIELSILCGLRNIFIKNSNEPVDYTSWSGNPKYIPSDAKGKNMVISSSFYALFGKKTKK